MSYSFGCGARTALASSIPGQGLPKDADCEAAVTDIINPTGKGWCARRKPAARILETDGCFPPSRPRRGCEDCYYIDDDRPNSAGCPGCLIEKKIGLDYTYTAAKLRAEITDEDRARWVPQVIDIAAIVAWANESSAIAERPDVQYCVQKDDACWYAPDQPEYKGGAQRVVTVDDAYLTAQAAIVRERLKMAGVRLAAILNTALMAP